MTTLIDWQSPAQQPDDNMEVVIALAGGETTGGYIEEGQWYYLNDHPVLHPVMAWADFPAFDGIPAPVTFSDIIDATRKLFGHKPQYVAP